jgi:hypothetical protein
MPMADTHLATIAPLLVDAAAELGAMKRALIAMAS